jgi:mono/diheme cytochrome c family protein
MPCLTKGKCWTLVAAAAMFAVIGSLARSGAARAADAPANPEGVKFFEAKIRPILADTCVGCHGPDKQKGGLRMDTRENLLKGGKDEEKVIKVVEPGDPAKSLIIEAINYKNEDMQMPPPKKNVDRKLTDAQIKDMTEWVKMGVPYGDKPVEGVKQDAK